MLPASALVPNKVPCGPLATSIRSISSNGRAKPDLPLLMPSTTTSTELSSILVLVKEPTPRIQTAVVAALLPLWIFKLGNVDNASKTFFVFLVFISCLSIISTINGVSNLDSRTPLEYTMIGSNSSVFTVWLLFFDVVLANIGSAVRDVANVNKSNLLVFIVFSF